MIWSRDSLKEECTRQAEIHRLQAASDRVVGHLRGAQFHDSQIAFWRSLAHELDRTPAGVTEP